jgi:hypothetical protein
MRGPWPNATQIEFELVIELAPCLYFARCFIGLEIRYFVSRDLILGQKVLTGGSRSLQASLSGGLGN